MNIIKIIFDMAFTIFNIPVILFGFSVSLWNVIMYSLIGTLLLIIFFKLTK